MARGLRVRENRVSRKNLHLYFPKPAWLHSNATIFREACWLNPPALPFPSLGLPLPRHADDYRLFVGDLGNEVTDEHLAGVFRKYASFAKARVIREKWNKKSKGYGFVSFVDG